MREESPRWPGMLANALGEQRCLYMLYIAMHVIFIKHIMALLMVSETVFITLYFSHVALGDAFAKPLSVGSGHQKQIVVYHTSFGKKTPACQQPWCH